MPKDFCLKMTLREIKELYLYLNFTREHYHHPALDEDFVLTLEQRIFDMLDDYDMKERLAYTE